LLFAGRKKRIPHCDVKKVGSTSQKEKNSSSSDKKTEFSGPKDEKEAKEGGLQKARK